MSLALLAVDTNELTAQVGETTAAVADDLHSLNYTHWPGIASTYFESP